MPIVCPVVLCVVGILVSQLPPADVHPADGNSSWLGMGIATVAVLAVVAFALHQLRAAEPPSRAEVAGQLAGNP